MAHIASEIHADLNAHKADLAADQSRVSTAFDAARAIAGAVGAKGKNVQSVDDLAKIIDANRPGR
jgi:hypothetical protein